MSNGKRFIARNAAFLFILPSLIGIVIFFIAPFFMSLGYAFSSRGKFVGLENFAALFGNASFLTALWNTLKFMACAIPLNMIIPLFIAALLFNEPREQRRSVLKTTGFCVVFSSVFAKLRKFRSEPFTGRAAKWLKALFMSPLVIPAACTAFFFQSFFGGNGPLSEALGVTTNWIQTEHSFAIAVGVYIWKNMGYNLVLALAGLSGIPKDYYEWSSVEGMGKLRSFFNITTVYMVPTLFIMFVMSFISSFKVYRELYMLAGNYPNENIYMLQHYMNNQFEQLNYQNLTASALVITAAVSVFCILFFVLDRKSDFGE